MQNISERKKTLSRSYYDDEIEFIYPNGDIHLKERVKRLEYQTDLNSDEISHINHIDLLVQKRRRKKEEQTNEYEGDVTEY